MLKSLTQNRVAFAHGSAHPTLYFKSSLDYLQYLIQCSEVSEVTQSCPTLCDPRDGSPPVPVILQAGTLEWVAISFSSA